MSSYSDYLAAKKCCAPKVTCNGGGGGSGKDGPQGPQGPTGPFGGP